MRFLILLALTIGITLSAVELPSGFQVSNNGVISFPGGNISFTVYAEAFRGACSSEKMQDVKSRDGEKKWELSGKCTLSGVSGTVSEQITTESPEKFTLDYSINMDAPVRTHLAFIDVRLFHPDVRYVVADGKELTLPLKENETLFRWTKKLTFILENGKTLTVFPSGVWYSNNSPHGSDSSSFRCEMRMESQRYFGSWRFLLGDIPQRSINLKQYANRDFKDDVANDDKGGWSDQGPGNDLRMIKPGKLKFGGINYDIIDADENNGNAVIALAGKKRTKTLPESMTITLPHDLNACGMSLLHATAWSLPEGTKTAEIIVEYADGSTSRHDLISERDIMNWWGQRSVPNARPAFSSWNIVCNVGLFASHFTLKRNDPRKLTLRLADPVKVRDSEDSMSTADIMWFIPAITFTELPVSFKTYSDKPIKITPGKEWIPLDFKSTTVAGSPLDFSFIADAPAGKYGAAKISPDGDIVFDNGKKIRLWGVNLCQEAICISKKNSDALAGRLVRCGYNAVRLHHYENRLISPNGKTSLELDPEKLDLFFYQIAALKKAGIYLNLDLYASREFKKGELPGEEGKLSLCRMKAMIALKREYQENFKEFCRRLLLEKNPYTGLSLAEDPALISVNIINEDNPDSWVPFALDLWEKEYAEECRKNPSLDPHPSVLNRDFLEFVYIKKQLPFYQEIIRFCKEELGLKAHLTSLSMGSEQHLALVTRYFDWIDKHCYFAHPVPLRAGSQVPNAPSHPGSPLKSFGQPSPFEIMITRYAGKPFGATEWTFGFPNQFRHEGTVMFAAYAALQNWDEFFRFQWACGPWNLNDALMVCSAFDAASDPVMQLSDRIASVLFVRGDVKSAQNKYLWIVPKNILSSASKEPLMPDARFQALGRIAQIGIAVEGDRIPDGWIVYKGPDSVLPEDQKLLARAVAEQHAVSSTGEIDLDANNQCLRIVSPRTEVLSGTSGSLSGKNLSMTKLSGPQTLAAISLDKAALPESTNIVLIHMADVQNSNAEFNNELMLIQQTWGELPLCVKRQSAEVSIRTGQNFKVTALGPDGDIRGEIAATYSNGILSFKVDTGAFAGGVMAYHLSPAGKTEK